MELIVHRTRSLAFFENGLSLIEVLVVVAILGILMAVGLPEFRTLIADQRLRSAASDLVGELAYARAEAIKQQRRVVVERTGATWRDGWKVYVDANANNTDDDASSAGDPDPEPELRRSPGFSNTDMRVCDANTSFADRIVFRGDGAVANAPAGAESGLRVVDSTGAARTRIIAISVAGRAGVELAPSGSGGSCG